MCLRSEAVLSSSVFTEIGIGGPSGARADRLFRGAVSAFCSLPRPSREDAARLDDLTLPLLEGVSIPSRRFAAAALSECERAPHALSRRLCDDAIEVAAPLLVRLKDLSDVELIGLIGRRGVPHAQVIGRRAGLNPVIASLVRALSVPFDRPDPPTQTPAHPPADAAETTRRDLRGMMRPTRQPDAIGRRAVFLRLRDSALGARRSFFETALADALGIWFEDAQALLDSGPEGDAPVAFKALGLRSDEAFLLMALLFPAQFVSREKVAAFLDSYEKLAPLTVNSALSRWRATERAPAPTRQRA
ncbi:MAG: hypothetical protein DI629_03745 [Mesorhizobium amorphae]|nr:MAG: hypothetical protein DI629_03745 [Mesorhizobium amorphae]